MRGKERRQKSRPKRSGPGERFSYNNEMAHWWLQRSRDASHARAYRNIAGFIRASYLRDPGTIVDYACGAGNLLALLSRHFPHSRLVGLDGSSFLLRLALRRISRLPARCARRISLIKTPLPQLNSLRRRADLAVFCFPNMVPFPGNEREAAEPFPMNRDEWSVARLLAPRNPDALRQSRDVSMNLRRLLIQGGICVRVEYATANRHELSPEELLQVAFEEGSLDVPVDGWTPRQWFRVLASAYFRSQVLEDVYEQTGDERDRNGGYLITVLRAV